MDFSIPGHMQDLLGAVRAFIESEVYPLERRDHAKGFKSLLPELARLRGEVKQRGWWLPQIAKEHGGLGLSLVEHGLLSAELGRSPLGHYCFNCQAPDSGNMEILIQFGTPEQQKTYLEPLLRGDIRSCFAMTEPEHAGSNPVWMSTTAVKDGSDYVINGHKWYTSSAEGARFAVVMAVTDPNQEPHFRASMILVPLDNPGYCFVRNIGVMGDVGEDWASHAEVRFEDCRVPQSNLLGGEGMGFAIAQERLGPGRIHHCMRWIGICERSFDIMCKHAATREVAPGVPLGTRQMVQQWIADSRAEINAARLMVLHAAWTIEQRGAKEARDEISLIKFYVANTQQRVVDRAIQCLGGFGVCDDSVLSHFYRHERPARIYDGPDEVHKQSVAKRILKRHGITIKSGANQ
ncbi:MAG: acyl-CoA dehydrogenase family protein [Candidatus Hydrogenedentes bacterium]|nr:acyl-CoA dehydrogenase family protein [Candidatus Hydrogenedentota bacterium]